MIEEIEAKISLDEMRNSIKEIHDWLESRTQKVEDLGNRINKLNRNIEKKDKLKKIQSSINLPKINFPKIIFPKIRIYKPYIYKPKKRDFGGS